MEFSSIKKLPISSHLAIICKTAKDLPKNVFTAGEMDYLTKSFKESSGKWLAVNQYKRWVFVFVLPKENNKDLMAEKLRKAGASLCQKLNAQKAKSVALDGGDYSLLLSEGMALANYQYLRYFSKKKKKENTLSKVSVLNSSASQLAEIQALCSSVNFARDLINTPVWDLTAEQLADQAKLAGKEAGFKVDVFNKKKIESLKMGGLLAVNKGSVDPPVFIVMEHKPKNPTNKKPLVIVGKGVVYDTGGLSLKPTAFMDDMKSDMSGSAAVIGTMKAVAETNLPLHVIGLVPATDNRPGGNAVTPGDVITISDGTTVEVMNTDAEGRLILADALHYAKKYDPELVIDLATLTGSAVMAIGRYGIVAMGTAKEKAWNKIMESGERVYERVVQFPFWSEYDELLKSPIADLKNIGTREGGAITAGKFLANFTDYPYIHLDIAGPAFIDTDDGYLKKGGTGVGIRLLFDFFKNYQN